MLTNSSSAPPGTHTHLAVEMRCADKKLPGLCPRDGLADFCCVISFTEPNLSSSPSSPCSPTEPALAGSKELSESQSYADMKAKTLLPGELALMMLFVDITEDKTAPA